MLTVTVIDYGIGNLLSVQRAFEYCGVKVVYTNKYQEAINSERLVLPGVGAFGDGMKGLRDRNLIQAIKEYCDTGRPFLGICLGMQMMLEVGEEFGCHEGLGIIPGRVVAIPATGHNNKPHKIPHIGWNELHSCGSWQNSILDGVSEKTPMYFVHSYTPQPTLDEHRLADVYYNGRRLSAIIRKGNIYGCQFHPEKSGAEGLKILRNWLKI